MAKKLDPQEIEQSRRKKTRADNREERKERIHDGIRKNRESGGAGIVCQYLHAVFHALPRLVP